MSYVVLSTCTKDMACIQACPVDCFYDAGEQLVINPDECIDCGACIPECPAHAIATEEEVAEDEQASIAKNRDFFVDKSAEDLAQTRQKASG